jgi:DNA-binding ferritin-like protein
MLDTLWLDAAINNLPQNEEAVAEVLNPAPAGGELNNGLIKLAAELKLLETQAHLIHLNYEAPNFLAVHAFLKDQYETHLVQFDTVAELIRARDSFVPISTVVLTGYCSCFREIEGYDPRSMLMIYYDNVLRLADVACELESLASSEQACDVANELATLVGQLSKTAWFLKATLRGS